MGTTADPHCMNCNKSWNEQFLVANLNRSFCEKKYKEHRKKLLTEREISKLPETMHLATRQKKVDAEDAKRMSLELQMQDLNKQLRGLKNERRKIIDNMWLIRHGAEVPVGSERRKFIMACPNNDCNGYLSTQYKCELCELFTCHECLEIIGYSKTDPHTCIPDSVASAAMIKKDTKPCPQCGIRIFKIGGCSQMWCTECKIAFNYNTLKIDTGAVHNPHYYMHMAQQNNGVVPRNPQDVLCGGLISVNHLHYIFNKLKIVMHGLNAESSEAVCTEQKKKYYRLTGNLANLHQTISHITYHEMPRIRTDVRELQDGEDLRIKYILGKTDKKEIGTQVYRRDVKRKKETGLLHLYELLSVVGIENFNALLQYSEQHTSNNYWQFIDEIENKMMVLDNLREYCNKEFAQISVTYNATVMFIGKIISTISPAVEVDWGIWKIGKKKYKISDQD